MLIRRIAVENFRKLRDPVEINDLQPGLNVIVGDNEEGKSTLLKAVQAALFDKHNLTGQAVKAMLPLGSTVQPKVEVHFQLGEASYRLQKGFSQSKFAQLENAEGRWENAHAEEQLEAILGFTRRHGGAAQNENMGLSGPLWIEQGRTYEPLELNEDAKKALNEVIESEVNAAAAGDSGLQLLSEVNERFHKYFTKARHSEKGILIDQRNSVELLKTEIENLEEKKQQHDGKLSDLEEIMQMLPMLKKNFRKAQQKVKAVKGKVGKIERIERKIEAYEGRLDAAKAGLDRANFQFQSRKEKTENLSNIEEDAKRMSNEFSNLDNNYKVAKRELDRARHELDQAQLECKKAKVKVNRDRLNKAEGIAANIAESEKVIEEILIGNEGMENLRELEGELKLQRAKLEAMATMLVFRPSAHQSVLANGEKLEVDRPRRITEKSLFELEGFGGLEVTPGGDKNDMRSIHVLVGNIRKELTNNLKSLGYSSIEEAGEAYSKKSMLRGEIGIAKAKLDGIVPAGLENLRSDIERLQADLPAIVGPILPVLSVNEAQRRQCTAQDKLNRIEKKFSDIQGRWNEAHGALKQQNESIDKLRRDLQVDREETSDEQLRINSQDADRMHEKVQRRLNKLNTKLEKMSPALTRGELRRKDKVCNELQGLFEQKNTRKIQLESELHGLGHKGLGEELDEKRRKNQSAHTELVRRELDAQAWELLKNTLEVAQQEERVPLTPLIRCLAPYVELVFPSAELHLDENSLEVGNLGREHSAEPEPFASLSIGTREQIAVLVRLAMADILHEQGKPVMLIFDDPLVNSDDSRFVGMSRALRKAAKHLQILILTCHADRYQSIGAKIIRLMEPKKQTSIVDLLAMPNAERIDFEPARLSDDLGKPADLS